MPDSFIPSSYSYLWRSDLAEAITDIAEAAFPEVELKAALPHIDPWDRADKLATEIRAASERTGLGIAGMNPSGLDVNIGSPDGSMRDWSVDTHIDIGRLADLWKEALTQALSGPSSHRPARLAGGQTRRSQVWSRLVST